MKKVKYLIATMILAIIMLPVVFAKDNVSIESYELVKQSDTTTELSKPKVDGLNISFDLSFTNKDDFAKYKIIVNNSTKNSYEISKDTDFNSSEYITYEYEFENNNNVVKANSKLIMYVTITYEKEVPIEKMKDGKFIENNKMAISLASDTSSTSMQEETNPNTSTSVLIICVLGLSIALLSLILFGKTKKTRYITTFMFSLLIIPTTIFALEKIQINIETKITIEEKYGVYYHYNTFIKESEKDQYLCVTALRGGKTVYIVNGERYIHCNAVQFDGMYKPGERVRVNSIPFIGIETEYYDGNNYVDLCTYDNEANEYTCPEDSLYNGVYDLMSYSKEPSHPEQENDPEVMNIEPINENVWDDYGYIDFNVPGKFTMPKHDVVISAKMHLFE